MEYASTIGDVSDDDDTEDHTSYIQSERNWENRPWKKVVHGGAGQSQMAHQPQLGQNRTSFFQHEPIPQFLNYNRAQASGGDGEKQIQQQQMAPERQANQEKSRIPGPRPQQHAQNNTFFENNGQFRLPVMTLQPPKLREEATTGEFLFFKKDFEEMAIRENIPDVYIMKYLCQAIQSTEVKTIIQSFAHTWEGYQEAITTLKLRYGDEETLKISKMNELEQFNQDTKTSSGLFRLSALINSIMSNGAFQGETHRGSLIYQKLLSKLPMHNVTTYSLRIPKENQDLQCLQQFVASLASNAKEIEMRSKFTDGKHSQRTKQF